MRVAIAFLFVAGCGRIGFDPVDDAHATGDGEADDGMQSQACVYTDCAVGTTGCCDGTTFYCAQMGKCTGGLWTCDPQTAFPCDLQTQQCCHIGEMSAVCADKFLSCN